MNVESLVAQYDARRQELDGILAVGDAVTAEGLARGNVLVGELEALQGQIEAARALQARAASLSRFETTPVRPVPFGGQPASANPPGVPGGTGSYLPVLATPGGGGGPVSAAAPVIYSRAQVSVFSERDGRTPREQAFRFGQWLLATTQANPRSRRYCQEHGIPLAWVGTNDKVVQFAHDEIINASGGFLVPPEFESDLIDLREQYGVFRQYARVRPMRSDTLTVPRRTGGLTAYWVGDNVSITESTKAWDQVNLVAKKAGVLAKYSSELDEDAIIDIASDLASEISYAFTTLEDNCGFNGDGTSTYGGIVGVRAALTNLSGTIANIAGLFVGTGNAYSELTLNDHVQTMGKLPEYARTRQADPAWYCHRTYYDQVMVRVALASGGVTVAEVQAGALNPRFLGYPVRIAQQMPSVEANSQVCALFGSLRLGADFGDRRMTTIATSEHAGFAQDQMQIRGTERFDIVVHDVGNASGTASARVPGPLVGLITAAS